MGVGVHSETRTLCVSLPNIPSSFEPRDSHASVTIQKLRLLHVLRQHDYLHIFAVNFVSETKFRCVRRVALKPLAIFCLSSLSPGITGMNYHAQLPNLKFYKSDE